MTPQQEITPLKGLGLKKSEHGGVAMVLKIGMKVAQDYIYFQLSNPKTK